MFKPGDQVEIGPSGEVVTIEYVGPTLVEVTGGRWFYIRDGQSLDPTANLRIVPVADSTSQRRPVGDIRQ